MGVFPSIKGGLEATGKTDKTGAHHQTGCKEVVLMLAGCY